ncbi:MAG: hypothetical protein C0175_01990 [Caldisericum exile]|uniref:Uncharacterized protein n=1 Tax=Caldisericum exile TaxID=693075 RepID=A0A2J6X851_9BACT|nr:MAG: hypothetical protein C0175_01990 [Caldisericum exile]
MIDSDEKAITPITEVVMPNVQMTIEVMKLFQEIKEKVLDDNDIVIISNKRYIKRSGWRKIALAFNITTEIKEIQREKIDDKYVVRVVARAIAPNGRTSEEVGISDSSEFTGNLKASMHNIESKAVTRAINRAISNLVGGGELSAEEIIEGPEDKIPDKKQDGDEFQKGITTLNDFFALNKIQGDIEIDDKNKRITIFVDLPNETFNELRNVMRKHNIEYLGRKTGGGSIWGLKNGK